MLESVINRVDAAVEGRKEWGKKEKEEGRVGGGRRYMNKGEG